MLAITNVIITIGVTSITAILRVNYYYYALLLQLATTSYSKKASNKGHLQKDISYCRVCRMLTECHGRCFAIRIVDVRSLLCLKDLGMNHVS